MGTMRIFIVGLAMLACTVIGIAQTLEPTPPALLPQPVTTSTPADLGKEQAEIAANIMELQELKTQNEEILKEQQAALDTLEQLEKDADQIKIFSKRG